MKNETPVVMQGPWLGIAMDLNLRHTHTNLLFYYFNGNVSGAVVDSVLFLFSVSEYYIYIQYDFHLNIIVCCGSEWRNFYSM